jgi:hypothetical protein
MTISDLKDLKKLITLCRSTGVESITVDGISLKLGEVQATTRKVKKVVAKGATTLEDIDTPDELTEEQLMYYSSGAV